MAQKNDTPALIVSLLLTIGLLGAGVWWLTQRTSLFSQDRDSTSTNVSQSEDLDLQPTAGTFAQTSDVPQGVFNYGGSTTWASIRGSIDETIQQKIPTFRLRYLDPLIGLPGSGSGISMLINGELAFAQSSRSLRPEEYQAAEQRGFTLKEIPVAIEGVAIAVNPSLPITGITVEQLRAIYVGEIVNWSQVGGPNQDIVPLSRPSEGGTVEFFTENVLGNRDFGNTVRFVNTTTEALRALAENPGAIYYASAPEVIGQCTIKPLAIGRQTGQLVAPYQEPLIPQQQCPAKRTQINQQTLKSGEYPITRRLFVIIKQNGQADQQAGEAYARLLLSDEGQTLLSEAGFVPIR